MSNGLGGVQAFRANAHAVHDAAATEQAEWIIQIRQTFFRHGVPAVRDETVSLQQAGRADEPVRIPPERRAGR